MFEPSKLSHLLEDRVTVGKGLEEPLKAARAKKKAGPFSLQSLIDWLEKQPADKRYDFWAGTFIGDCEGKCLLHQYLHEAGKDPISDYGQIADIECGGDHLQFIVASPKPWTFGAALTRAQAALERLSSPILIAEGV